MLELFGGVWVIASGRVCFLLQFFLLFPLVQVESNSIDCDAFCYPRFEKTKLQVGHLIHEDLFLRVNLMDKPKQMLRLRSNTISSHPMQRIPELQLYRTHTGGSLVSQHRQTPHILSLR